MPQSNEATGNCLKGPSPCDACRSRKIRCDRQSPCSNCKTANINCIRTEFSPPKRKRIHLSDEYNSDISDIKHGIEKIWSRLNAHQSAHTTSARQLPGGVTVDGTLRTTSTSNPELWPPFEEESSFRAVLQRVVDGLRQDSPLSAPLTLQPQTIVMTDNGVEYRQASRTSHIPPFSGDKVLRILEAAQGVPDVLDESPFIDLNELSLLCQKMYFPVTGFSACEFITVQSCIFLLTQALVKRLVKQFDFDPLEIQQILSQCSSSLIHTAGELPLLVQPAFENIRALLLLILVYLETDRFATASNLTSIVCRLCLDAGYHRLLSGDTTDKAHQKRLIFWKLYVLDRGFALSLGKAPAIPEYEICLDRPLPGEVTETSLIYFNGWIEYAEIQGEIYEKLYSPRGQRSAAATKLIAAQVLAKRLTELTMNIPDAEDGLSAEWKWCGEVAINTMLTLVYFATEIDGRGQGLDRSLEPESLTYARIGLDKLNEAWEALGDEEEPKQLTSFLVWSVQFSPFAPFVVVLRNAFINDEEEDMIRLRKAMKAIETTAKVSSGIGRLHNICDKLLRLTDDHVRDRRQNEARVANCDKQFTVGDYDFVAVMEDSENMPLFMDSWEAFLNLQN